MELKLSRTSITKMSINEMPYPEPELYEEFKKWSNETIQGYELTSFAMIEDSMRKDYYTGAGWNVNMKPKTNKEGVTIDSLECDDLKEDLEQQFKEKSPEVILTSVKLLKLFLPNKVCRRWSVDLRRV